MWRRIGVAVAGAAVLLALLAYASLRDNPARPAIGERRAVVSGGAEIEYFVSGRGGSFPVALVASWGRSASDFNELVSALNRAGFATLAIQHRGVDGSTLPSLRPSLHTYAADLAAAVEAEGIGGEIAVIGHAYGNRVARTFATDFPERVAGVVLLAAGGSAPPPAEIQPAMPRALLQVWPETTRAQAIRAAFFAEGNPVPEYWMSGWYPLAGIAQGRASAATPYEEWGAGGSARMLILEPRDDALARGAGERLRARFPSRVELEIIEGAGHALLPEQPAALSRAVLPFLVSLERAAGRGPGS
ncbi:MAG: alpha/beta fold hydrolase [Deltaproteobacteria bacterium]|nr:alpha/beta fold hydrolase [Deltaproteobacteria bacterium]MBW2359348.1 alpha/beta fold hydrolase [Deltaproteobacteria bacterium]